ncbi:O-antigen ligase family protein [Pedobacter sp. ISL-64]|uniref:O-antigen ligase family protein n=1 Tax=Pedobacter sp. ISL-64 TaxID=2819164 RepID=UPI001BE72136|nr:O-antigen ligase family protein [Pedobacter sp. ISL-64]MBT2562759.1 O-antigen ligase family protein [Pedobacter sp. ISL-64]
MKQHLASANQYTVPVIRKTSSVEDFLIKGFLIFLPFSQALTINIMFPLKLSEICLLCLISLKLASGKTEMWKVGKPSLTIIMFCICILISLIINTLYTYNYPLTTSAVRISPTVDSVLKFIYVFLVVAGMFITTNILKRKPELIKFLFIGAIISASYSWYLFFSGILHLPVLKLPGMEEESQMIMNVIRSGTFKEGNYMGFYLLLMGIISFFYERKKMAYFFWGTILTTFSTASIFCLFLFFVIYTYYVYKKHKLKLIASITVIAISVTLLTQFSDGFRSLIYNKIFASEDSVENTNDIYSRLDRLNTTITGLKMAASNPFFGVGLSSYGMHYSHFNNLPDFDLGGKRIPNNIYVEILSETGIFVFILFIYFLYLLYKRAKKVSNVLAAGILASCVYFFAFPTFTMLFIWVFFSVILSAQTLIKSNYGYDQSKFINAENDYRHGI